MKKEEIIQSVKEKKIEFVELKFSDIYGNPKSFTYSIDKLDEILNHGVFFDGSSIGGLSEIEKSDMMLKPDIETAFILPEKKSIRFIADIYTSTGEPAKSPRNILKKLVEELKEKKIYPKIGAEIEFHLLLKEGRKLKPIDNGSYLNSREDSAKKLREELMLSLKNHKIDVDIIHHEVGPGQQEIGFKYGSPVETADRIIELKRIIKKISSNYNYIAVFSPKPFFKKAGSGMHIHISLFDENGKNIFYDKKEKISEKAKNFIAGELKYIKEISAVTNPLVNSYKRLVKGFEAPVYICYGFSNRSSLIRIPLCNGNAEKATRIEIRSPDASCNPYLAFALLIKAGVDGIKEKLPCPEPVEENVYEFNESELKKRKIDVLPESLGESVKFMEKSRLSEDFLGKKLFDFYIKDRTEEWKTFLSSVTDWELKNNILKT